MLTLFAAIPAIVVSTGWAVAFRRVVPALSGSAAWDSAAATGKRALDAARQAPLTRTQRDALDAHETMLSEAVSNARRIQFLSPRFVALLVAGAAVGLILLAWPTWRAVGHLSRQLSRPLDEIVQWTEMIAKGQQPPPQAAARGAPEFEVLRAHMRAMAAQLEAGRARALEAERLRAFRESSRRFAHELKNPLTPIRFAVARLRRDVGPELRDTMDVLATESERLEAMARSFAQFGRLPEGPAADVDVGELARYAARAAVPDPFALKVDVSGRAMVRGQHDALERALSNVLLNAVEACGERGSITISVRDAELHGASAVRVGVRDDGPGISAEKLRGIWDPYVTNKPGGTGLGLAIARQSIESHGGDVFATSVPGDTEIGFTLPVNAGLPAISGESAGGL